MFGRKECKRCGEGINKESNFCPSCGVPFNKNSRREDFGMIGENDFEEFENELNNSIFGRIGGRMINKMFESAVRMLEKEMEREIKRKSQPKNYPRTNFQLYVNGKKINVDHGNFNFPQEQKLKQKIQTVKLPQKALKNFSKLQKQEPETNVRRFADKIIYEINMPGVKSEKNISVIKLENSIEIKAIGNKVAYQKVLPINLPVMDYHIGEGKLILELSLRE